MSRWLTRALEIEKEYHTPVRHLTECDKTPPKQPEVGFCQVLSNCHKESEVKSTPDAVDDFKHGFSICGRPKTWTGKIVSMQEWHQLSTWDKHGPDGRLFNGLTQRWEHPQDGTAHAEALADQEQQSWDDAYFRNTRF